MRQRSKSLRACSEQIFCTAYHQLRVTSMQSVSHSEAQDAINYAIKVRHLAPAVRTTLQRTRSAWLPTCSVWKKRVRQTA